MKNTVYLADITTDHYDFTMIGVSKTGVQKAMKTAVRDYCKQLNLNFNLFWDSYEMTVTEMKLDQLYIDRELHKN
jgi:hypothetical protein